MRFRSYDSLKLFGIVARHCSITRAAEEMNQSKGSVSYQIARLEEDLGFALFHRRNRRLSLTKNGERLWHASQVGLRMIDDEIDALRGTVPGALTIAVLTYFSSRWLSPRLMGFIERNPGIALRIEPVNGVSDLGRIDADIAILWGNGMSFDMESEVLMRCPAFPTASPALAAKIEKTGLCKALAELPLLSDSSGDKGWRDWFDRVGWPFPGKTNTLVLADSNSRVQAVIDGQGVALWDALITPEIQQGLLQPVSEISLEDYGYHQLFPNGRDSTAMAKAFRSWISTGASIGKS